MKRLNLLYLYLKNRISYFITDTQGIFTILTAFAAVPLIVLSTGTIDLVQMASFENQIKTTALIAIRAGGEGFSNTNNTTIQNIIIQNMQPYQYTSNPSSDQSSYNFKITTNDFNVYDTTVPNNLSYGHESDLIIAIEGNFIRNQSFAGAFSVAGEDGGTQIKIDRTFKGTKYLPPIEIALVIDLTKFQPPGSSSLLSGGDFLASTLLSNDFSTYITSITKQRSIRIMIVPYSSTVNVSYALLNTSKISYLNRSQKVQADGSTATGQCLTETWNNTQDVSSLPSGIATYQNYYRSCCSNANAITGCSPVDDSFQYSYTSYDHHTFANPSAKDSIWLNFNCPTLSLYPFVTLSQLRALGFFWTISLTIPTIENRTSLTKPLPQVGLLWATRYLNNPGIWNTPSISSKDPRTKKLLFLISGDAPLRQVPLAHSFWDVTELMHNKINGKNTANVWGYGALIKPSHTATNIDYYGALGYTNDINKSFIQNVTNTLNTNKDPTTNKQYQNAMAQYSNLTTAAIQQVNDVCTKIKQISNIHLYSVYFNIDLYGNTEGVLTPNQFRNTYHSVLTNSCNANPSWAQTNSVLTGSDYSTQILNALKSALTDSGIASDFSNYQITSI